MWGAYSDEGIDRVLWKLADLELYEVETSKRGGTDGGGCSAESCAEGGIVGGWVGDRCYGDVRLDGKTAMLAVVAPD